MRETVDECVCVRLYVRECVWGFSVCVMWAECLRLYVGECVWG